MNHSRINQILEKISAARVAVYGDYCLDSYWIMDDRTSEVSIETGLQALSVARHYYTPGGAGNVVANLAALQPAEIRVIGAVGDDMQGRELTAQLQQLGADTSAFIVQKENFNTYSYLKRLVDGQEEPRIDFGVYNERSAETDARIVAALEKALQECDALIFNQQVTGSISNAAFIDDVNALFDRYSDKIVMLDSRHFNDRFRNTYLKCNDREIASLNGLEVRPGENVPLSDVKGYGSEIFGRYRKPVFVTCGERGIIAFDKAGYHEVPGIQLKGKLDTVGAGDTAISAITLCLAAGLSPAEAAEFGNFAAAVTVQKLFTTGTATGAEIAAVATEPDYIYNADLAENRWGGVTYYPGTEFEVCVPEILDQLGHIRYAVFDHDGTISSLRQGWEEIMEPVMMKSILGDQYDTIDAATFHRVEAECKAFINKTTGIQTIYQMEGLVNLVREFGFVPENQILDKFQYKEVYNAGLMEMVNKRMSKLASGELGQEDYTLKGAVAFLQALKARGVTMYLASGTDVDDVRHEAEALGYADLFDGGIYGALRDYTKFSKKMVIEKIIRDNHLQGKELAVFGDGPDEIREGRRAGGIAIGITSNEVQRFGHNPAKRPRLIRAGAQLLIPDFSQHQKLIRLLFQSAQKPVLLCLLMLASTVLSWAQGPAVYQDKPFLQDYCVKFYADTIQSSLLQVAADRNGIVQMLAKEGLRHTDAGQFLYPGKVVPDRLYRYMTDKKISSLITYQDQLVYLTDQVVFSNAWAGTLFSKHNLPNANLLAGGKDFTFLVSDGTSLELIQHSKSLWNGKLPDDSAIALAYQAGADQFWVLGKKSLYKLGAQDKKLSKVLSGTDFTAFDLTSKETRAVIGTIDGYLTVDLQTGKQTGSIQRKLPATKITAVREVDGKVWFGSDMGAFALRADGKFDYYYGERWLPGNVVLDIAKGPKNSVLVLTKKGLGQIHFKAMTLEAKAMQFEEQVRLRHIRNGFNAQLVGMKHGDLSTGFTEDSDNDGLWTSMYLGGEIFRYATTKDPDALQNCRESMDAMERLYTVNPVAGFPARSFERSGHMNELHDIERWQHSPEKEWDWKSTTSSDEVIGHIFAFGAAAELVDDPKIKKQAIMLIDTVMSHIVKNDLYLIDYDGKPTMWGKWHPDYVNSFPTNVGDRKLNSSNIVAMLQTAYHFTKKEKYKAKAMELMTKHGYFENMMRPMSVIGRAPDDADEHAKHMSDGWNHSDDEMYFLGYWGLYRYALNDTLKAHYKKQIIDHWQAERPEKEGAWNIFTALTGTKDFDLDEAAWYLREHPMDLIDWTIRNSHRKDVEPLALNFRKQTLKEVLPPDERPIQRHNANMFNLDRNGESGAGEHSAGDIWLLPYWMGRYLRVISAPQK